MGAGVFAQMIEATLAPLRSADLETAPTVQMNLPASLLRDGNLRQSARMRKRVAHGPVLAPTSRAQTALLLGGVALGVMIVGGITFGVVSRAGGRDAPPARDSGRAPVTEEHAPTFGTTDPPVAPRLASSTDESATSASAQPDRAPTNSAAGPPSAQAPPASKGPPRPPKQPNKRRDPLRDYD